MCKPYSIGIDVGGTKIAAGLVERNGTILCRQTTRGHAEQEPDVVIKAIDDAYHALMDKSSLNSSDIEAVGIGFAGNTNGPAGIVLVSSNLPAWDRYPLRDTIADRLKVPVLLDNDTNLCALGEYRYGAGRGTQNMCYVTLSTGLGLGIIIDGRLYVGHTGTAGELGHVTIEVNGPPCTCGKRGCLMTYASGIGISRIAKERIRDGAKTTIREMVASTSERIPAERVAEAAMQGDEIACEIIETAANYCGLGLSIIVQTLNPEVIVVGGGLTRIGSMLLDPALKATQQYVQPEMKDSIRVVPWQLGDDVGILGAAAKVFSESEC